MLLKIIIKDYILIDSLEIDFDHGFNVLTGETGAGKSIILGAIRLALGDRNTGNVIRMGAKKATIQAVFILDNPLEEDYPFPVDDEMVIFTREIFESRKSIIKINDHVTTLQVAKSIANKLLNIHGQNDYQHLLEQSGQLALLDVFLDSDAIKIKTNLKASYKNIQTIQNKIEALSQNPETILREIELVKYQMDDIDAVALTAEDNSIEEQYKIILNAQNIVQALYQAINIIESDTHEAPSLNRQLNEVIKKVEHISEHLSEYKTHVNTLNDIFYSISELKDTLQNSIENMTFDERALYRAEKRMDIVNSAKKKYGHSVEEIMDYRFALHDKLKGLENQSEQKNKLEIQLEDETKVYQHLASHLTQARKKASKILIEHLKQNLLELHFDYVDLDVLFQKRETYHIDGLEYIDILIALNKGQLKNPLRKVASGGEISRIMLALKSVIADKDSVDVLVFDEIDSGISGVTASVVAEKLYSVSKYHQIICISHLAQVALMADRHFTIVKDTSDDNTISKVMPLTESQRVSEISRIIGGKDESEDLNQQANQLLKKAKMRRERLQNT